MNKKKKEYETPWCDCGLHKRYRQRWKADGSPGFHAKCEHCRGRGTKRIQRLHPGRTYGDYKKENKCARCGFIAEHHCQMDIDHIDGDRTNGSPSNMQTLCSNCHRLKSFSKKKNIK